MKRFEKTDGEISELLPPDEFGLGYLRSALEDVVDTAKNVVLTGSCEEISLEDSIDWDGIHSRQKHWDEKFGYRIINFDNDFPLNSKSKPKYAVRDLIEDARYTGEDSEFHWILLEIENYAKSASETLDGNDIAQFLEIYDAILEYTGNYASYAEDEGLVGNWAGITQSRREAHDDDISENEARARIFAAMNDLSVTLAKLVARQEKTLMYIEWRQLEHVIAAALDGLGYDVELTPEARDGGKDIVASCLLLGKKKTYYIELKHWRSGKKVGDDVLFDFIQVNLHDKTDGGILLSSSGFTETVYSTILEMCPTDIKIGGARQIRYLCKQFSRHLDGLWRPISDIRSVFFGSLN